MEIVIKVQPIDIVLSPLNLHKFLTIIDPLLEIFIYSKYMIDPSHSQNILEPSKELLGSKLPLFYLDIALLRIFIPVQDKGITNQDTAIIQVLHSAIKNSLKSKFRLVVSAHAMRCSNFGKLSVANCLFCILHGVAYTISLYLLFKKHTWLNMIVMQCFRSIQLQLIKTPKILLLEHQLEKICILKLKKEDY